MQESFHTSNPGFISDYS